MRTGASGCVDGAALPAAGVNAAAPANVMPLRNLRRFVIPAALPARMLPSGPVAAAIVLRSKRARQDALEEEIGVANGTVAITWVTLTRIAAASYHRVRTPAQQRADINTGGLR
jgi:hypothetical protein